MTESQSRVGLEIAGMVRDRRIDGMARMLAGRHGAPIAIVEDAIGAAAVSVLERAMSHEIRDVAGYFFRSAENKLKRLLASTNRHVEYDELDHPVNEDDIDGLPKHTDIDAENLLTWLKGLTNGWNVNLRVTADIVLDAAFSAEYEEPTAAELAEELESVLLEPVSVVNARQWKSRALRRLRDEVASRLMEEPGDRPQMETDGAPS